MSENLRKLVTIRRIAALDPIEGADAIEVATVEGWKVVVKKNEFKVGDQVVYFEIDSFLPTGNPAWQFLVDKSSRTFEGVVGHRLRTVKLRGQVSQGFIVPLHALLVIAAAEGFEKLNWLQGDRMEDFDTFLRNIDFSNMLDVKKWEAPLPAELAGQAEGLFPSWMHKTDQERCQNLQAEIFQTEDVRREFDVSGLTTEALETMQQKGLLEFIPPTGWVKVDKAKADPAARYEITMKMDGSSATFFHRDGEVGACSRNLQLKINEENAGNSFVKMLIESGLQAALPQLGNIAIQGELMGPGIQGNRENLKDFVFFVFEVQLLDEGRNARQMERYSIMEKLYELGINAQKVRHVPIFANGKFVDFSTISGYERLTYSLRSIDLTSVEQLLQFAEGPSITHPVREGVVFKREDGEFSFKAISNAFLAKEKD